MSSHSILVTGATGGIGAATVRALADRGHTVYATARGAADDLAKLAGVHVVRMDVTDPASVQAAAAEVSKAARGLRAVVNNAGIIVQGPLELVPPEELQRQFAVNTFGPAYVTQAFLPLLRAGGGRVVNVSAPTARVSVPLLGPIGASKAALESLSASLRMELASWGIPVTLVEPGATETAIFTKAGAAARDALADADPVRVRLYERHLEAAERAVANQRLAAPERVAATIVRAVQARSPKRRYATAPDARMAGVLAGLPESLREVLATRMAGIAGIEAG